LFAADIEREQKSLDGVQKLLDVYRDKPTFADADTREEVNQRHVNVRLVLRCLTLGCLQNVQMLLSWRFSRDIFVRSFLESFKTVVIISGATMVRSTEI